MSENDIEKWRSIMSDNINYIKLLHTESTVEAEQVISYLKKIMLMHINKEISQVCTWGIPLEAQMFLF